MNLNMHLGEAFNLTAGFVPVDMSAAANNGDYVSLKEYQKATIVLFKAAGTAGDDVTITLQQAKDVSGTSVKNLVAIDRVYRKEGTLTSVGQWTVDEQTAAATWTNTTNAENQAIIMFDVFPEQLDLANDFDCIRANVADVGVNPQLGCVLYLLWGARVGAGDTLPSAIVD